MSKDVKRMSLEEAESFTSDQATSAIKSCRTSIANGPDSLSIFHMENLGPMATEHLTALYNDSLKSCRLPSMMKTTLVIPIPRTHRKARPTSRCYAQQPRSSWRSLLLLPTPLALVCGGISIIPLLVHQPAYLHLANRSITPVVSVHKSRGDRVVRIWVQLKRWCVSVLQRGHSGDGCELASTLCKYDLRKGDLFVLSWARVRRVRRGSLSSELLMCVEVCAVFCYCLLWLDA